MKKINNGKQMTSTWKICPPNKNEKIFGKHPTQKPIQLLERIILASTNENDIIFDPFSGSSTTGVAALKLNRKFVGCDLNDEFLIISIKRLNQILNENTLFTQTI